MRIISAATVGFVIQAIGLCAFALIANGVWASPGKELVIAITCLSMAVLLFFANRPYTIKRSILISALLAAGYLVAFHVLGIAFFSGLLKDFRVLSTEYLQTISSIFGVLFGLYFLGSAIAGFVDKFVSPSRRAQSP